MRLNLGSGGDILPGYINCDLFDKSADLFCDAATLPFLSGSVSEILASHILEHFTFKEAFDVLKEWKRVLKPGGKLIIETPDFLESCRAFVGENEEGRINLYGHFFACPWIAGQTHKFLYTESQLRWTLLECGFREIRRIKAESKYLKAHSKELFLRVECAK